MASQERLLPADTRSLSPGARLPDLRVARLMHTRPLRQPSARIVHRPGRRLSKAYTTFEVTMQHHADPIPLTPRADLSSAELVKEALAEARHLIRLEVALAKEEVRREVSAAKKAGIALGAGAFALVLAVALLFVALALAIFPGPVPALVIGLVLLFGGAFAVFTGVRLIPKKPLGDTIRRIETDIETVKERVA